MSRICAAEDKSPVSFLLVVLVGALFLSGCASTANPNILRVGKILKAEVISAKAKQVLVTTEKAYITIPFGTSNIPVGAWGTLEKDYDGTFFFSWGKNLQLMATNVKFREEGKRK